ncbi:piggyBac transposable element-derived protein 2-like, partial [Bradysia coprophila]|uniref:piggyBac transposable element-derived protein 2-like n=1 Tax=Bradysia coprophila TaxID=38358 RepID=UPI00187DD7AD
IYDSFNDSEIECNDGDDDDDFEVELEKRIRVGSQTLTIDDERFVEGESDDEDIEQLSDDDLLTNDNLPVANIDEWTWTAKEDIKWHRGVIQKQLFEFELVELDDLVDDYLSPVEYFIKYVPETVFDDMVTYTNLYAEQQKTKKWQPTDKTEIKTFIGLQIQMDCTDKFVRVRPLMNAVRARCLELPVEECLSIDEQMIPMRGRVSKGVKQYVKNKPKIKWGIKNLVLCGKSGLAYDFVCYQGSTTEFNPEMLEAFGSGATMVLHLANRIERSGHKLFFDNYFSSFQLFEVLAQKKIYAAGTIRLDRFAKPPFSSDSDMKKKIRGCSEEVVSSDRRVTCVKWFDNKCVALASNYVGIGTPDKANRFDKATKQKITIDRPQIVKDYNLNMGGVDLMNQMISYYRISIRSKKWTLRMITHFIDFAIVNSWIEYKNDCEKEEIPKRQVMDLLAFRMKLANQLVYQQNVSKRTARTAVDASQSKKARNQQKEARTEICVRFDEHNHYPVCSDDRLRCKLETCNLKSSVLCEKCKVHLCFNKNKNCFRAFHIKS